MVPLRMSLRGEFSDLALLILEKHSCQQKKAKIKKI